MNWLSALGPGQWAVMLSIPPLIVLLYFLKLKRSPLVVPSTYLWKRTIEDIQVNSLWQRLRKNLLLLLQLLFILFLIIACLRPGFRTESSAGNRLIFLLDNSASMQATDVAPNRFEVAKKKIRDEINAMVDGDVAMLIAFSNRADVRQGFTSDRSRLVAALDATQITNRTSDISEALRAAAGLANPGRSSFGDATDIQVAEAVPATIRVFSDGRFKEVNDFNVGNLTPQFVPIGDQNVENVGLVAFSIDRNIEEPTRSEAYARVLNASPVPKTVNVRLEMNGELIDASELEIPADETRGVSFEISGADPSNTYVATIEQSDALKLDNSAVATLRPDRKIEVLVVSEGSQAIATVMATSTIKTLANSTFIEADEYKSWAENGFVASADSNSPLAIPFDIVMFDGVNIEKLPPANVFAFGGRMPADSGWTIGDQYGPIIVVDWDRSHPIMQFLTLGSLRIVQGRNVNGPENAQVLMRGDSGTLFSVAPRGAFLDAVMGFGLKAEVNGEVITNTDWPIKPSFPVFMLALLENIGGAMKQRDNLSVRPGETAVLSVPPRLNSFVVTAPDGSSQKIERDNAGQLVWTATDQPGLYRIAAADNATVPLDAFVVNLLSTDESTIGTKAEMMVGYQNVAAAEAKTPKRQEFWRSLLLLGLVLLVFEWVVFSKRVFV